MVKNAQKERKKERKKESCWEKRESCWEKERKKILGKKKESCWEKRKKESSIRKEDWKIYTKRQKSQIINFLFVKILLRWIRIKIFNIFKIIFITFF